MKLIFLDVDGVLNSTKWYDKLHKENKPTISSEMELMPKAMKYIGKLVEKTGAKVVLSSTWRMSGKNSRHYINLTNQLRKYGVEIVGCTPVLWKSRGMEIQRFIESFDNKNMKFDFAKNKYINKDPVDSIVIIDDDNDMLHLTRFLVQTRFKYGFTFFNYLKALRILRKGDYKKERIFWQQKNDWEHGGA